MKLVGMFPLSVFLFPAFDRVLDTDQSRGVWSLAALILDQPLHRGPVTAHFAEQIIEQGGFSQRTDKQLFGGMLLAAYPAQK
jgi:hypothetical protein